MSNIPTNGDDAVIATTSEKVDKPHKEKDTNGKFNKKITSVMDENDQEVKPYFPLMSPDLRS
jgi:hypothetical protein